MKKEKMTGRSRIIIIFISLMLSVTYFVPLWEISLEAPQYPEGLGLEIWINKIDGQNKGDVNKINNLNHYIGMKEINEDLIPELKYMPWIMRVLMMIGVAVGITGNRKFLLFWISLFVAMAVIGLIDYYMWGYDFGHNLDMEKAIIKVPGTSFQPPLIGSKQILNFRAVSLPGIGGYVLIACIMIASVVYFYETKLKRLRG